MLKVPGVSDREVIAGVRPEGFVPEESGPMICKLSGVEVMGRDVSVVSTHLASLNPSIRSIVGSDLGIGAHMETIRYSLKPHKVFLFDRETEARVPFEVM